jgi:hypothetical protein
MTDKTAEKGSLICEECGRNACKYSHRGGNRKATRANCLVPKRETGRGG